MMMLSYYRPKTKKAESEVEIKQVWVENLSWKPRAMLYASRRLVLTLSTQRSICFLRFLLFRATHRGFLAIPNSCS
jgi:hypothetical protein